MRHRSIVVALVLVIVAVACGDDDGGGIPSPDSAAQTAATAPVSTSPGGSMETTPSGNGEGIGATPTAERGEPVTMWVPDFALGRLATVDLRSSSCTLTDVGIFPELVAFGLGGIWITDGGAQQLVFVDPADGEVLGRRDVGGWPSDLALSDTSIWVAIPDTDTVLEIDPEGGEILNEMPFAEAPSAIAVGSYAVGTWDGPLYYDDMAAGNEWMRDMGGSVYDTQFYGGNLWALVVHFEGKDHAVTGSEIWAIRPDSEEAVLFAEVPDHLTGILIDDYGVWANSRDQGEMAWWDEPAPTLAPAQDDPLWTHDTAPSFWRAGGRDIFDVDHHGGRATQVVRAGLDHDWGLPRTAGDPPLVWSQPGTTHYDLPELCGDPKFAPSDVAAATQMEVDTALAATPDPWESDPLPTGPVGSSDVYFASCSITFSKEGPVGASGELDNAEEGAIVTFSVSGPDGVTYVLGTTAIDADGAFDFAEQTPPIDRPFTIRLEAGGATCETPVDE